MKDNIFKTCIIIIGIIFLSIYFFHSQNGRFHKIDNGVIDTRTGIIYSSYGGLQSINLITGKIEKYDPQIIDKRKLDYLPAPAPAPAPEKGAPAPAPEKGAPAPAS